MVTYVIIRHSSMTSLDYQPRKLNCQGSISSSPNDAKLIWGKPIIHGPQSHQPHPFLSPWTTGSSRPKRAGRHIPTNSHRRNIPCPPKQRTPSQILLPTHICYKIPLPRFKHVYVCLRCTHTAKQQPDPDPRRPSTTTHTHTRTSSTPKPVSMRHLPVPVVIVGS
ncbi:hypothetical protein BO79DRAFT_36171 [Aspergillus costaricaensis CBS 115574]|uniref:Uncharacterized protein n=1 Tax=Aspergillus costaricaensis CBS 115574 TaxID=1448317 RepID=A0ACD1I7B4_9EURO|nr:hypothetical protein BO79DRAFT_36171 [Aspergillus costaricaensis CBS 115574]RAK86401.1 hypothetical protein BO79DRAFT_36171 [Aspergillus costaricaensis CBS 115574]